LPNPVETPVIKVVFIFNFLKLRYKHHRFVECIHYKVESNPQIIEIYKIIPISIPVNNIDKLKKGPSLFGQPFGSISGLLFYIDQLACSFLVSDIEFIDHAHALGSGDRIVNIDRFAGINFTNVNCFDFCTPQVV
jgi:hypothetical protein